jgi:CxxC motif-containing protein
MQCISALARIRVSPPIKIGEVVLDNFLETGVDVIATDNL